MATDVDRTGTDAAGGRELSAVLGRLRRRIRRYVFADAIAQLLAVASLLLWASLAVDWLLEPPRLVRGIMLAVTAAATAAVVVRLVIARTMVPISRRSLALLIERRFPEIGDRLITAVDAAELESEGESRYYGQMLSGTQRGAADRVKGLDLDLIFNGAPLVRSALAAGLLMLSIAAFVLGFPAVFRIWGERMFTLADVLYPRYTRLSVEGFEQGAVKVARGGDYKVVALADTKMRIPEKVQLRYHTSGLRDRVSMDREGRAFPGREPFQKYSYTFHVLSPILFDIIGGDDRLNDLRIEVVEVPAVDVSQTMLSCQFPAYLDRQPRDVPVTGTVSLPRGADVVLHAVASKRLVEIEVTDQIHTERTLKPITPATRDPHKFDVPLGSIDAEQVFLFTLRDDDGVKSREPWRLALSAIADDPPKLALRLRGIGSAITPNARIPVIGPVNDDYGLARVWLERSVGEEKPVEQELLVDVIGKIEVTIDQAIEVEQFGVSPGKTLQLQIKAKDNCGLEQGANVSTSDTYVLQVVTPEELRAMLESRELNLRRRFEQLLAELTATRESLPEIKAHIEKTINQGAGGSEPAEEPGDAAEANANHSDGEHLAAGALIVERGLQNSRKNADETLGIAVAFDDMHDELVNNRIDTEELKSRLKEGIADPLHRICATRFPELDRRLVALQEAVTGNLSSSEATLLAGTEQLDVILAEMQQVLDKMMEMETFNEVVDMLRSIVQSQERLNRETKAERRQAVKRLLED